MRYILASKSPRRREILENIGLEFETVTSNADENINISNPEKLCEALALKKGSAVAEMLEKSGNLQDDDIIISADTVVAFEDNILGKPKDKEDAKRMLKLLSGNKHRVISGVALIQGKKQVVSHSKTYVYFDEISDKDIDRYIESGEPFDKAGAYGIQGLASLFVKKIDGCYFGVVGLPVNLLNNLHKELTGKPLIHN